MYSFLEYFYKPQIPIIFGQLPWWRLFLPLRELTGSWCTSTLILIYYLERLLTPAGTWELLNAVAIVTAFWTSWAVYRSAVFSLTLAICIGFGTQFYHAYPLTGGISSYALVTYHMLLLFTVVQVVRNVQPGWVWRSAFALSLALNVVAYEGWLDLLVLAWVVCPFVFVMLQRQARRAEAWRAVRVVLGMTFVGILYIVVKVKLGYGQAEGTESDVIFNYTSLWPVVDDLVGNVFTHTFLSVSNFLPPFLVGASSFYRLGADPLLAAQHRYHEAFSYLVVMNQVFFWRYYAGIVFAAVVLALYVASVRGWKRPSAWSMAAGVFLIMLLVAAPTHTVIKYRPMNSEPAMTYHVTVGVLGMSLLLAWLLTTAWREMSNRTLASAAVGLGWALILSSAFTRPPYLAHMAAQSGLGTSLYPNPLQALLSRLHLPYDAPRGEAVYRLTAFDPYAESARIRALLGDLPMPLPPPTEWESVAAGAARAALGGGAIELQGDDSQSGYQLMSPSLTLEANTDYLVRVKVETREGRVCAGVLSADQQRWLAAPSVSAPESSVRSAQPIAVRVVIANCNDQKDHNVRSRIRLLGGSYAAIAARP